MIHSAGPRLRPALSEDDCDSGGQGRRASAGLALLHHDCLQPRASVTGPGETDTEITSRAAVTDAPGTEQVATSPAAASAPRTRLQRVAGVGFGVVAVLIVLLLAAWLLFPALSIPSERLVSWRGGARSDPTSTVIQVEATGANCFPDDRSWQAPPMITYMPWAVIITLHTTDAFAVTHKSATPAKSGLPKVGCYLSGPYLTVQLSEPLGGRMLFDGSQFPPAARP